MQVDAKAVQNFAAVLLASVLVGCGGVDSESSLASAIQNGNDTSSQPAGMHPNDNNGTSGATNTGMDGTTASSGWRMKSITYYENNGSGMISEKDLFSYDADGKLKQITMKNYDNNVSSSVDKETFVYTNNPKTIQGALDINSTGTVDDIFTEIFDANGRFVREEKDTGNNGTVDRVTTYEYDNAGHIVKESNDRDNDETVDSIKVYTYDDNGRLIQAKKDWNHDGTFDQSTDYQYDGNGRLSTINYDFDMDGTIDYQEQLVYDNNGNRAQAKTWQGYVIVEYTWEQGECTLDGIEDVSPTLLTEYPICGQH